MAAYKVSELVQDRSSLVVIIVGASGSQLGEVPVAVVGARLCEGEYVSSLNF